jgi:hypothetical protein
MVVPMLEYKIARLYHHLLLCLWAHSTFWDGILVSIISIAASIAAYFVIKYLLKRTADSLNLDKRELKGITQ